MKENSCDFDWYRWFSETIEIGNDFLSITIDSYRSIIIDKLLFSVTSISIDFRYHSILIGGLNRLISMISNDFLYRFLSINYVWGNPRVFDNGFRAVASGFQVLASGFDLVRSPVMGSCLVSGTWILIVKVQRDSGFLALHYGFQSPGSLTPQ